MLDENIKNIHSEETENKPTPEKTQEVTESDDQPTLENTEKVSEQQEDVAEVIENKDNEEVSSSDGNEETKAVEDKIEVKTSENELEATPVTETKQKEIPKQVDYSVLSLEELVSSLKKLIKK